MLSIKLNGESTCYSEVLENAKEVLKISSSKIRNRRLHLQELIAKRDRISYEIVQLKKKIASDKKNGQRAYKKLNEHYNSQKALSQENYILEENESLDIILPDEFEPFYESLVKDIQTIESLLSLPPFSESEIF